MEDFQIRLLNERNELKERLTKLKIALLTDNFRSKVGVRQYNLMVKQCRHMKGYLSTLEERIKNLGIDDSNN